MRRPEFHHVANLWVAGDRLSAPARALAREAVFRDCAKTRVQVLESVDVGAQRGVAREYNVPDSTASLLREGLHRERTENCSAPPAIGECRASEADHRRAVEEYVPLQVERMLADRTTGSRGVRDRHGRESIRSTKRVPRGQVAKGFVESVFLGLDPNRCLLSYGVHASEVRRSTRPTECGLSAPRPGITPFAPSSG